MALPNSPDTTKFPSPFDWSFHLVPPEEKTAEWFYSLVQSYKPYMVSFFNTSTGTYGNYNRLDWIKLYAEGLQPEDYYREMFDPKGALAINTTSQFNYVNLNYKIVSVIPKYARILVGKLQQIPTNIEVEAIDPLAKNKKNEDILKLKFQKEIDGFLANISAQMQLSKPMKSNPELNSEKANVKSPISELGDMEFDLDNEEELKIYMNSTYKLAVELAQEQSLKAVMDLQEFDQQKKYQIAEDLVNYGKAAVRCYTSQYTGLPVIENINLGSIAVAPHKRKDFKDSGSTRMIEWVTLNKLIELLGGELTTTDVKELFDHAVRTYGYTNERGEVLYYYEWQKVNRLIFDRVRVPLGYWEINSTDVVSYDEVPVGKSETKRTRLVKAKYGEDSKGERRNYWAEVWYSGYYIDGIPKIYKFEKINNMTREWGKEQQTRGTFHLYTASERSPIEQMMPHADEIQLASLKIQHALLRALPDGWSFNVDAIQDVVLGNSTITATEIVRMFMQTGSGFHKTMGEDGSPLMANANSPHAKLLNGISETINKYIEVLQYNISMIEAVIGYNPVMAGAAPEARQPVSGLKIAAAASDMASYFLTHALVSMTTNIAKHLSLMVQNIVKHKGKPYEALKAMIGETSLNVIESMDDIPAHQFGIFIKESMSDTERDELKSLLMDAYSKGNVALEDVMLIFFDIHNYKEAIQLLNIRRRKMEKKQAEAAQAQMQMQQQQIDSQNQLTMALTQADNQTKNAVADLQGKYALMIEQMKQKGKLDNTQLQNVHKDNQIGTKGQVDLQKELLKQNAA